MTRYGIHWFRRDLRIEGNPALRWNYRENEGRVVGLFCFDKTFLARSDFSRDRFQFFLETLLVLRAELRENGGDLLVLDEGPLTAFPALFETLRAKKALPTSFSFNRDYEPFAVERDRNVETLLRKWDIPSHTERDHLLLEPHEIYKGDDPDDGYVVYTPFARKWLDFLGTPGVRERIESQRPVPKKKRFRLGWDELLPPNPRDLLREVSDENKKSVTIPLPPAGHRAALARLREFKSHVSEYAKARDFPSIDGTSKLSVYLKNGSITTAQIIGHLDLSDHGKFMGELVWREFYYHVLFRFPYVEKGAFQKKYSSIKWENDETKFAAWREGRTGYPIVDAAMRQLNTTGWMHNRLRMITASFLTKDLLVNWQWGERYFMEKLLDGDLAPNNGGWQWAASTGCDAQPYFRIFNPYLQSKKFDADGIFIRRFIPELSHLKGSQVHEPSAEDRGTYPPPIVDHAEQRALALELYGELK